MGKANMISKGSMTSKSFSKFITGAEVFYDMTNPRSYPGSGTDLFDLSPNGNDAILVNGVTSTYRSLVFDGVDQYLTASFDITPYVTTHTWVKYSSAGAKIIF